MQNMHVCWSSAEGDCPKDRYSENTGPPLDAENTERALRGSPSFSVSSAVLWLREQAPLGAAGVGLFISAVAQRRKRELGEYAIPAVAGMEAVRRVIRGLIQARVAEQIHDQHALRGQGIHAIGKTHRDALDQALVSGRTRRHVWRAAQVRQVERDDAGVGRTAADARDQTVQVGAPLADLRICKAVRIRSASRSRTFGDDIGIVATSKNRHVRRGRLDERRLPFDEVSRKIRNRPANLTREVFDDAAQNRAWQAEVAMRECSSRCDQIAPQDLYVARAVRTFSEWHAWRGTADADAVAGTDRVIDDGSVRGRWAGGRIR